MKIEEASDTLAGLMGLGGLVTKPDDGIDAAKACLDEADALLAGHKRNKLRDHRNAKLRAAAELTWLALLNGCHAILLRHGRRPTGNAGDVGEAVEHATTPAERRLAGEADDAASALHGAVFYRNDGKAGTVERWIEKTHELLDALKRERHR